MKARREGGHAFTIATIMIHALDSHLQASYDPDAECILIQLGVIDHAEDLVELSDGCVAHVDENNEAFLIQVQDEESVDFLAEALTLLGYDEDECVIIVRLARDAFNDA